MTHKPRKVQRLSIPLFRASEQRFGLREVGRRKVAVAEPPTVLLRGPKRKKNKKEEEEHTKKRMRFATVAPREDGVIGAHKTRKR